MSENEIWSSTSLSTLRSSSADNRSSIIELRNLFFINAIRLNERSPEQVETIKHMNMRSAVETFGNVSCSSSVCINLARSDGDEHPLHLAKVTKCTISSAKQQTADLQCTCLSHAVLNFECCHCLNIVEVGYHFKHISDVCTSINSPSQCKLHLVNNNKKSVHRKSISPLKYNFCSFCFVTLLCALAWSGHNSRIFSRVWRLFSHGFKFVKPIANVICKWMQWLQQINSKFKITRRRL